MDHLNRWSKTFDKIQHVGLEEKCPNIIKSIFDKTSTQNFQDRKKSHRNSIINRNETAYLLYLLF